MNTKKIIPIGAGNVATHIARKLYNEGYTILQVYSRSVKSAKTLAQQVGALYTTDLSSISDQADFYIFSLKDSVLEEIIQKIPHNNGTWAHTSGSMPMSVFENRVEQFGVIYPLQTFSKKREIEWEQIPLFIEGNNDSGLSSIRELVSSLSKNIHILSSENRKFIHLSGVFACNFTNYMYDIASKMVEKSGLPFDVLLPLIDETAHKVHHLHPHQAQTGPAIRYEQNIIDKHIELIDSSEMKALYKLLSDSIHKDHQ